MLAPHSPSIHTVALGLTVLLASTPAPTQVHPAAPEVLSRYALEAGTVQELVLPLAANSPFQVRVVIDGVTRILDLRPHDVRSENFRLLVDDGDSVYQVPTPASVTFRGEVAGAPTSVVSASLIDGQLDALVLLDGETWGVQPLTASFPTITRAAHLIYREADRVYAGERCGNTADQIVPPAQVQGGALANASTKQAEIALDLDNLFYTSSNFGRGNVTTAQNAAISIVNGCTVIYKRDVSVEFVVTTIIVRTTAVYSGDIQTRLGQFRSRWRANQAHVPRDLAHLFSGQTGGGVIGVASVGVICNMTRGFGASQVGFTSSRTSQVGLVCHEVGHQFSAPHCNGASSGCLIMCSSLGGCGSISSFAPVSIAQITSYAQSLWCLTTVTQNAPTLTSIAPSSYTIFRPPIVTLQGTELDTVTSVQLGTRVMSHFSATPTALYFHLPNTVVIGSYPVTVTNPLGTSNTLSLAVIGNHPSVMEAPAAHFRGTADDYVAHTDAGWIAVYYISSANGPSVLPGFVSFGIGNGFTSGPYQVAALATSNNGAATLSVTMPMSAPSSTFLYWQLVTYDPAQLTLPVETSNVAPVVTF